MARQGVTALTLNGDEAVLRDSRLYSCRSGQMYISKMVMANVRKNTAHIGCAGQILCVRPNIQAAVPIALAAKEAFRVFMVPTPSSPRKHGIHGKD